MMNLGQAIVNLRLACEWTQQELAARAMLSSETISNIERGVVDPQGRTLARILRALGIESPDFDQYVRGKIRRVSEVKLSARAPQVSAQPVGDALVALAAAINLSPTELARRLSTAPVGAPQQASPGLRLDLARPARRVPEYPIGIAASHRVEKVASDHPEAFREVDTQDARVFTAPVDGDCMEPKWLDGEIAVFSYDAFDREGIMPGRSYYLAFTDGTSTFKRVFTDPQSADHYLLECWNLTRYPERKSVHYREVVRIARAVSKVIVPDEE